METKFASHNSNSRCEVARSIDLSEELCFYWAWDSPAKSWKPSSEKLRKVNYSRALIYSLASTWSCSQFKWVSPVHKLIITRARKELEQSYNNRLLVGVVDTTTVYISSNFSSQLFPPIFLISLETILSCTGHLFALWLLPSLTGSASSCSLA